MLANSAQEEIIQNTEGQMIVVACPGSGKTTTLLRRIRHMVKDGIDPESILMITFTKAAAKEMKGRYASMYGAGGGVTFCTIHALCLALLRKFAGFSVDNVAKHPADYVFRTIQYDRAIRDKGKFVQEALNDISIVKNSQMDIYDYEPKCCNDPAYFRKIYRSYTEQMDEDGLIDYDDMLIRSYSLLSEERDILDWIRDKYAYIHVDEYQDTNFLQRDIIYLIAGGNGNITVVGDDDQSIYGFRGARPEVMAGFKKKYPEAKEVYMVTNYRSDKVIINHASLLIQQNKERFRKEIKAASSDPGRVCLLTAPTRTDTMELLAAEIKILLNKKINPTNIAVLYRTNAQSTGAAEALHAAGIPFYSNEAVECRYDSWVYQDMASYFKVASGKGTQQDYIRTVTHPNRFMERYNYAKYGLDPARMQEVLTDSLKEEWKNIKTVESINDYLVLMDFIKNRDVGQALHAACSFGGYREYLSEYAEYRNEDDGQYQSLIDSYGNDIKRWDIHSFEQWDHKVKAYTRAFRDTLGKRTGICLSTMHKAKGLEWDYVFIIDCIDGMTPYKKSGMIEDIEEERRLFYVAMTRAKHSLTLVAHQNLKTRPAEFSRFLYEADLISGR